MTLSQRIETAFLALLDKYRDDLNSGVVAQFAVTFKVSEHQQIIEVMPALARRYKTSDTPAGVRIRDGG